MKNMPTWLQETLIPEDNLEEKDSAKAKEKAPTKKAASSPAKSIEPNQTSPSETKALSVSEVNKQIKHRLENDFGELWIKGEISNFTNHRSGHYYFSLKDDKSQISIVMFKGFNAKLNFQPENGMDVIIKGKISVYEPRGNYQIMCQFMEPVGAGALQKAFEQLKAKLQKEGLFAKETKKVIPKYPQKIALITSPTGAAIRDMLNVLKRRARGLEILVIETSVQGEKAAPSIVEAIKKATLISDIDVIICGRGGGSTEDLWAFNEEIVARAIHNCPHPIVSAVGHEIDFTISDFVADLRAPTPSAAAELIVANFEETIQRVNFLKSRLSSFYLKELIRLKQQVFGLSKRLVSPQKYVEQKSQRLDELENQITYKIKSFLERKKQTLSHLQKSLRSPKEEIKRKREKATSLKEQIIKYQKLRLQENTKDLHSIMAMLDSLSPLKVMERGYAITLKEGKVIKRAKDLKKEDKIEIRYFDKSVEAKITKK